MTKSILVALVLVGLSLGIMWVWFSDRPASDPVNIGAQNEQAKGADEDSSGHLRSRGRDNAAASLANNMSSNSPGTPMASSSEPIAPASKLVRPERGERRPASAFPNKSRPDGLAISGLVQDEEGYPIAEIKVLAEPIHPSNTHTLSGEPNFEAVQSAWTSFDGSFKFGNLADGEYRIRTAPIEGFAEAETTARVGVMSTTLVLVRLRNVRVYGIVNDTEGEPLKDIRVVVSPPTRVTNTGPRGFYEIDVSVKGKNPSPTIYFRHKDFREQSIQLAAEELDNLLSDVQLDISMEPLKGLTTVTGRLVDSDGLPVAGKILSLRSSRLQSSHSTQSDLKGDFSLGGVEPGKGYKLTVRPGANYRDFEKTQLEIPANGLELIVVLEEQDRGELSGWMTDIDGNSIPGFALTLHSQVATGHSVHVVGDQTGFFSVKDFPIGNAVLKTNSYPVFETQNIRASRETEEPVRVVIDRGPHALRGRVTNIFGDTVAAPEVSLGWQHSENGVQNYSARKTAADQNGNFMFTGLGSGVHTLRVNAPGFSMAVVTVNVGMDSNNIVVELDEKS